jgi:hypothetical protein
MYRKFKPPFFLARAISPDRGVVKPFFLMKIPVLLLLAWVAQQSEAREVFQIAPLPRTQSERLRRLALAAVFGSQAVWNKSTRRIRERGGAL